MVDQARARRLAKRITQIVADALEHEVKDPRLAMVTITDTRVTGDLREATVYYTVLGDRVDADPDAANRATSASDSRVRASSSSMWRAASGTWSGTNTSDGVCRIPVPAPTSVRSTPVALANAAAAPAESGGESIVSPSTV